ncbi:uncharacterized mitochondrial protein AtMg00810-like [Benincasa hispida]|uniref:uncharacterized mitochondrial protein AtMg00810-like n=1 Tax=Benincasa hispida TaxID=102211 RepID=UPI00190292B9|nr:uncharacterized mitochondrial protein AtMg00810-like [Benincasa hispida]
MGSIIFLLVYVDDIIITSNNPKLIEQLIGTLAVQFALKDLGQLWYFLGIQVHYLESGLLINQSKYVDDLLQKFQMTDVKPMSSPSVQGRKLSKNDGQPISNAYIYRSTIGALQYLTHTQTDITYAVNQLSQFLQTPTNVHWKSVAAYCTFVRNNIVSWSSKKQMVVARSNTESEYRALAHATSEVLWLQQLLSEMGLKTNARPTI